MSDKTKAIVALKRLETAAKKGDPRAIAEMKKLSQKVAALRPTPVIVGDLEPEPDDIGKLPELPDMFDTDSLETYDYLSRKYDTADQLALKVAHRSLHWTQLNDVAHFARTNPPSVLQGVIGGQQPVNRGELVDVAHWGGADAETAVVTVTVMPVQQLNVAPRAARPYAVVQFGTRGMLTKVEVDIGKGRQFCVTGSQVIVQVGQDPFQPGTSGELPTMRLAGMLSFHPITRFSPITRTRFLDGVFFPRVTAAVGTMDDIPPMAQSVYLFMDAPTAAATLFFLDSNSTLLYTAVVPAGGAMLLPIPLTEDVTQIQYQKTAGADADGRMLFNLSL